MPFKNKAQQRACYAAHDPNWDCSEWQSVTPKDIPEGPSPKAKSKRRRAKRRARLATNKRTSRKPRYSRPRSPSQPPKLGSFDPTRTTTLRRQFSAQLARQFARLSAAVVTLIGEQDVLGLNQPRAHEASALLPKPIPPSQMTALGATHLTGNCQPGQMRGADGRCGPGISLGLDRTQMPQIRGDNLDALVQWLRGQGVGVAPATASVGALSPVQAEFRQERVDALNDDALTQPLLISRDDYILDGTHRWIKAWQQNRMASVPAVKIDLPVRDAIDMLHRFPGSHAVENFDPGQERDPHGRWSKGGGMLMEDSQGDDPHRLYIGPKEVPVKCGHDIERAAVLLSRGFKVRLSQPHQVSTLLDKIHVMVKEAEAKGEQAPNFDLCKVSVQGTNLFCQDNIGRSRITMPQLRGTPIPGSYAATLPRSKKTGKVDLSADFIKDLKASGVRVTETTMPASHMRASQSEIVGSRVAGILAEAKAGVRDLSKRPIFVTRDDYIVDGHHHWAVIVGEGYGRNKDSKVPVHVLDMDIGEALDRANAFAKAKGLAPKTAGPVTNYDPGEARDAAGRWTEGGSSGEAAQSDADDYKTNGVRSRAFKSWFGDWENKNAVQRGLVSRVIDWATGRPKPTEAIEQPSVVRDDSGRPIEVYHGTRASFDTFDPEHANPRALLGRGFYFAESEGMAEGYGHGNVFRGKSESDSEPVKVMRVYLNIKKPFDADFHLRRLAEAPGSAKFGYDFLSSAMGGNDKATAYLRSKGYDGITMMGKGDDGKPSRVWIAFDSNQIKSVDNRGTFRKDSPNIYNAEFNYRPFVCNGQVGWFNAPTLLDWVTDVRQPDHYSCGASSFKSVMDGFGIEKSISEWKKILGTTEEESTHPDAIVEQAKKQGCAVEAGQGLTLDDLSSFLQRDMPVIVCCQDYGPRVPARARFDYGHYIVIIGRGMGYLFAQDPSEDNVIAGGDNSSLQKVGSIQRPGRIMIAEDDFLKLWHDQDADGNPYIQWGCAIGAPPGKSPTVNVSDDALREADFITLPDGETGTCCDNCMYESDGRCIHCKLFGQSVDDRISCEYWDAVGTRRSYDDSQVTIADRTRLLRLNTDRLGSNPPEVTREALEEADFIRFPPGMRGGTSCHNCEYQESGICQNSHIRGKRVTERNCCKYWDADGATRPWTPATNEWSDAARQAALEARRLNKKIQPDEEDSYPREGVRSVAEEASARATAYLDKIPGARWLREKTAKLKLAMEQRYGQKTAKRIFFVANAISWGAFVVGPVVGYPNYIPATWLMAAGAGLAEVHYQYRTRIAPLIHHSGEQLSDQQVQQIARQMVVDLAVEYGRAAGLTGNYSPDQPRDHGRFATSEGEASSLSKRVRSAGGFTYKPVGSRSPKSGYIVSLDRSAGWENPVSEKDFQQHGREMTLEYLKRVREAIRSGKLDKEHCHVGAWYDKSTKRVVLDVNEVFDKKEEAINVGRKRKQDAIFDLGGLREIDLRTTRNSGPGDWRRDGRAARGAGGSAITGNAGEWAVVTDAAKMKLFREWLLRQLWQDVVGKSQEDLWKQFIMEGFKKGAGRAFDDTRPRVRQMIHDDPNRVSDFYDGTKYEFLRSAFGQPVAVQKVQLMAGRAFDELKNVTDDMANKLSRILVDGLTQGRGPREIARAMVKQIGLSGQRASTVARTELVRAHANGQLLAYKQLGVQELGVAVEWSTTGDDRVCDQCEPMEGVVLTLDEAEGLIPRHPNCRCAFIPANVGESRRGQVRDREDIQDALDDSELDLDLDDDRPVSTLNRGETCRVPSGQSGGGQFSSCDEGTESAPLPEAEGEATATPEEMRASLRLAHRKIRGAPVPSAESIWKSRAELERYHERQRGRSSGEARGGSAEDRRRQRQNLFREWGGEQRGYIVCPWTGQKMHWTDDEQLNPHGYPKFERGKIFTKCQGGGYQLSNLIPESFAANRSRGDRRIRPENSEGCP